MDIFSPTCSSTDIARTHTSSRRTDRTREAMHLLSRHDWTIAKSHGTHNRDKEGPTSNGFDFESRNPRETIRLTIFEIASWYENMRNSHVLPVSDPNRRAICMSVFCCCRPLLPRRCKRRSVSHLPASWPRTAGISLPQAPGKAVCAGTSGPYCSSRASTAGGSILLCTNLQSQSFLPTGCRASRAAAEGATNSKEYFVSRTRRLRVRCLDRMERRFDGLRSSAPGMGQFAFLYWLCTLTHDTHIHDMTRHDQVRDGLYPTAQ